MSLSSTFTHANGRDDRAAHSASSVVFPQPGPADRNTTGTAVARSMTSISAWRDTAPPGPWGGSSFDSSNSNAGAGRSWPPFVRRNVADELTAGSADD